MTKDLLSVGKLVELTQKSPQEIQRALDELGIEPDLRLNDIDHYPRDAANKLRGFFYNIEKKG